MGDDEDGSLIAISGNKEPLTVKI